MPPLFLEASLDGLVQIVCCRVVLRLFLVQRFAHVIDLLRFHMASHLANRSSTVVAKVYVYASLTSLTLNALYLKSHSAWSLTN